MIIKHFFKAHFVQRTKSGIFNFWRKSYDCLTTLKKFSIATTWNPYLYSLGGRLLTRWSSDIISRPILSKNKRRGNYNFWPKSCEIHIFIVREGLFSSWTLLADCMTYWYTFLSTAQLGYRLIDWISKWFLTLTLFTNWMNDLSWLYGSWWIAWLCYM